MNFLVKPDNFNAVYQLHYHDFVFDEITVLYLVWLTILVAEGNEQKRKRLKTESDITRLSPSVRSQLENWAGLKGEQVCDELAFLFFFHIVH